MTNGWSSMIAQLRSTIQTIWSMRLLEKVKIQLIQTHTEMPTFYFMRETRNLITINQELSNKKEHLRRY